MNDEVCNDIIYKKGSHFKTIVASKEKAKIICEDLSKEDTISVYDWYFAAGRVVILKMNKKLFNILDNNRE